MNWCSDRIRIAYRLILVSALICLAGCQHFGGAKNDVSEIAAYYMENAHRELANDRLQLAERYAEAWNAITPTISSNRLLDQIRQLKMERFNQYKACGEMSADSKQRRGCLVKQLKYRPDYLPAVIALRSQNKATEVADLRAASKILESTWLKSPPKTKKVAVVPVVDKAARDSRDNIQFHKVARVEAQVERVNLYIAQELWAPAVKLLQAIEEPVNDDNSELTALKVSLAETLYTRGQRAFRTSIDDAIKMWEFTLLVNEQHPLARLKLTRAYKIRENLQDIK